MASIKAENKRSILRDVYDGVQLGTLANDLGLQGLPGPIDNLSDGLMWYHRYIRNDIRSGKVIIGSSGVGHSVQYSKWDKDRGFSPEEMDGAVLLLREIHDDVIAMLTANSLPTDDLSVFNAMMADDRLQTVTRSQTDYTTIRMPWVRLS